MGAVDSRKLQRLLAHAERARAARGWIFSAVPSKPVGPELPWDYTSRARELLESANSVLDLGTGGGERFSEICGEYEGRAIATEGWSGNVSAAARQLLPLGIPLIFSSSLHLPFAAGNFDLVFNRHEELEPVEISRVLAVGGTVLTQQVSFLNWFELDAYFPRIVRGPDHFESYQAGFRDLGMVIHRAERAEISMAFHGLEDITYLLAAVPWAVPDFDPARDFDALVKLESDLKGTDGIVLTEGRYVIEAQKPGPRLLARASTGSA